DCTPFSRVQVAPAHDAVLTLEVHEVGVSRIDPADKAVAAADDDPVLVDRADAAERLARAAPTAVVLQTAIDAVRLPVVHGAMIELTNRQMVEVVPVLHAVVGGVEAAVAADDHVPAVLRIDPQAMLIGVDRVAAVVGKCLAAVLGTVQGYAEDVDEVGVAGI